MELEVDIEEPWLPSEWAALAGHAADALAKVAPELGNARLSASRYKYARWVTCDDEREFKRFIEANAHRIAYDVVEAPTFLAAHAPELTAAQEQWPKVQFLAMCEHAGLVFQAA